MSQFPENLILQYVKMTGLSILHLLGYVGAEEDSENSYVVFSLISVDKKTEDMSMSNSFQ